MKKALKRYLQTQDMVLSSDRINAIIQKLERIKSSPESFKNIAEMLKGKVRPKECRRLNRDGIRKFRKGQLAPLKHALDGLDMDICNQLSFGLANAFDEQELVRGDFSDEAKRYARMHVCFALTHLRKAIERIEEKEQVTIIPQRPPYFDELICVYIDFIYLENPKAKPSATPQGPLYAFMVEMIPVVTGDESLDPEKGLRNALEETLQKLHRYKHF